MKEHNYWRLIRHTDYLVEKSTVPTTSSGSIVSKASASPHDTVIGVDLSFKHDANSDMSRSFIPLTIHPSGTASDTPYENPMDIEGSNADSTSSVCINHALHRSPRTLSTIECSIQNNQGCALYTKTLWDVLVPHNESILTTGNEQTITFEPENKHLHLNFISKQHDMLSDRLFTLLRQDCITQKYITYSQCSNKNTSNQASDSECKSESDTVNNSCDITSIYNNMNAIVVILSLSLTRVVLQLSND